MAIALVVLVLTRHTSILATRAGLGLGRPGTVDVRARVLTGDESDGCAGTGPSGRAPHGPVDGPAHGGDRSRHDGPPDRFGP